jgi:transcriptional regulator with XRE-family HTH domain
VRARRKELGLSQEELADRAQVHRTFIGHVERAETNVSIDNIDRISAALEISASALLHVD